MTNLKVIGTILASSAILVSTVAVPSASANNILQQQKVQINVATTETTVTKNELIERVHKLFPNKFSFVSNNDFYLSTYTNFQNDQEIRYHLHFSKTVKGKQVYGSFTFKEEKLEIEQFSYQPVVEKDAMFPAKMTKDEARQIATNFIGSFTNGEKYVVEPNTLFNNYPSRLVTEPIRYSFTFVQTKNDIPISDKQITVTVLGNGEVVDFYRMNNSTEYPTFDEKNNIKDEQQALAQIKENLTVDLQYFVDADYRTGKTNVSLIYQPSSTVTGVHALTGKWQTINGLSTQLPPKTKLEKIVPSPLPAKHNGITVEQAKEMAQKLLAIESNQVKLMIESVEEVEREGKTYISVGYMYQSRTSGRGSQLEINKQTGELMQYHNMKSELLLETGEQVEPALKLTKSQALEHAINYLKEYVPSYLHHYAMPVTEPYVDEQTGGFNFTFPRVVNGLLVSSDHLSVSIAEDGSLSNLYVGFQNVDTWPAITTAVPVEQVEKKLRDELTVKLNYVQQSQKDKAVHYDLLYTPIYNGNLGTFIDATTGEWKNGNNYNEDVVVKHPTAQQELNYLINAKILEVEDAAKFDGNAKVSQGDALKVIIKSLTYFYEEYMRDRGVMAQSFTNIAPDHPLYSVVERAVAMGIINVEGMEFNPDAKLTREELAVWYMRTLGLEPATKHSDIYQLAFDDAADVNPKYVGYVSVVNALGILPVEKNRFNPNSEITYAELAVSTILLAYELAENRTNFNSYY